MKHRLLKLCTLATLVVVCVNSYAEVFYAQDEALKAAFPSATSVERKTYVLETHQVEEVEKRAKAPLSSKLVTFFMGMEEKTLLGYALIDSHTVRTHTESILLVFSPKGVLQKTLVLAFHEPSEYQASPRWLTQFEGATSDKELQIERDISGIVGSTLTSQAIAAAVRRGLALYAVVEMKQGVTQ